MAPSLVDFKKDCLPLMEQLLDDHGFKFKHHKVENWFQFPWSPGKMYIVSGQDKIRGPNWAYGGINELTLIPLVRYKEFIGRVRIKGARALQVCSVGTPEGMASEYYDYMIEEPKQKFKIIYGNSRDNAHNLADGYIDDLMDAYDSVMQQAYIEGLWVNMTGNRFYYAYDGKKNEDKSIKEIEHSDVHVGLDFNVAPMAATCWNLHKGKLWGFDEITLPDNARTENMAKALFERGYTPDRTTIYPDPSGKSRSTKGDPDIKILKDCGYYDIKVRSKAPGFRTRQLNTSNLMEKGIINLNPDKMPKMRKDFIAVEQDPVTLEKIKKNKELTHHSDGFDYMCDILFPFSGKKPRSRFERIR